MKKDWAYLTSLTGNKPLVIERVAVEGEGVAVEGQFEPPPLARLNADDQVFVAVFVKCHGSIKQMEKHFNISYPTVKSRLNRIGEQLTFVDVETTGDTDAVLEQLQRGEIDVDEAVRMIKKGDNHE